jgi:geranylgeranyl diphosphate synthase, type I
MNSEIVEKFLAETKDRVDPVIEQILISNVHSEYQEMVLHQIRVGGKRLRPALAVASCFLFGGKWEDVIYPAASLEILHNYTLIVDDMIDRGEIRRGQPTTWKKYSYSMAHNVGMFYAASLTTSSGKSPRSSEVSDIISKTLKIVIEGEVEDILADALLKEESEYLSEKKKKEIGLNDYYEIISKKTASLISASVYLGSVVGGADQNSQDKIKDYGFNLGMAFQISDDLLDIFGKEGDFGKEIGKDIKEGKRSNIVFICALAEMDLSEKQEFSSILSGEAREKKRVDRAIEMIKKTGAEKQVALIGRDFVGRAHKSLQELPRNKWNNILEGMATGVMSRTK